MSIRKDTIIENKISILDKINIFGIQIPIRYKNQPYYSSYTGIIFSIITFIFMTIIIITKTIELFNYSIFSIITSHIPVFEYINLTKIPIMIGIIDYLGNQYEINEEYISISVKKVKRIP